ncbi:multiheme c-type cytochrome [Solidesulfovibrio sp.]|uniref:multiheme c-type cytochrome n=1 Tax=Solidesulfovibrio sp. TaxID=2910990 RepID=UPI002602DA91|nr:multiheme c-type cytochrome [Solidesulfovibrio sp.]
MSLRAAIKQQGALALLLFFLCPAPAMAAAPEGYAGSASCRDCHARFYELWSTSRHGLAMQPYDDAFAARALSAQALDAAVGERRYKALVGPGQGYVLETGPDGERRYPIAQVLGGKNVYYFLTPLERGRLQTLPIAYDAVEKTWFDVAASGRRRHHGQAEATGPVDWRDPAYTFNTSCHGCHVSQLSINYDPATDAYDTAWAEPGINCETCHGPSKAHNEVCAQAPKGTVPQDLRILSWGKGLPVPRQNDACASCHAKLIPITAGFAPGDDFFDHFDLAGLENPDYYPDGRDLGENFTQTSWMLSPCARNGKLSCVFCHTSSGRFKQRQNPDQACLSCHADKAANPEAHTRHKPDGPGGRCLSCHMPQTRFARMVRTDHSMLPPNPAATLRFGSPNACQGCHPDKDAAWADATVRSWRSRDYQAPVLARAALIEAARRRDWTTLPDMLAYLRDPGHEPVFAAGLARLLRACPDARKRPALLAALAAPSPYVRATAAETLADDRDPAVVAALARTTADPSRLVRVRAAEALAGAPSEALPEDALEAVGRATMELQASFDARPDDWAGRYNLGNDRLRRGDLAGAIEAYAQATRLRPDAAAPRINAAMATARQGDLEGAAALLAKAREADPQSAVAAFNLGLVLAELGRTDAAKAALADALTRDPRLAEAAYNLGLLTVRDDPAAGLGHLRRAASLAPDNAKYAKALEVYRSRYGDQ